MLQRQDFAQWIYIRIPPSFQMREMLTSISTAPPGNKALLIDVSDHSNFSDGTAHAILGEHMAERLSASRVAVLVSEEALSYNSERVAQQRRLNLRVFTRLHDAEEWLAS